MSFNKELKDQIIFMCCKCPGYINKICLKGLIPVVTEAEPSTEYHW